RGGRSGQPELLARLHHRADQRLQRLLVFVFEANPVGRPRDPGDAHLVDVANEVVVVVPPADPQPDRGFDVEGRFPGGIELAVQVDPTPAALIRVRDVNPLAQRNAGFAPDVGEIAVDVEVWRAAELHPNLAAATAALVAPAEDRRVRPLRSDPG